MSIRAQIEKKIENKKQEIVELEGKVREANAFLQGLQEALKVLPKEGTDERRAEQVLRPGSNMAKARDLLRRIGKPMYIVDILQGIGVEVTRSNRASISGSLGNYARKGEIFTALGRNMFGLVEFGALQAGQYEPPDNFGINEENDTTKEEEEAF